VNGLEKRFSCQPSYPGRLSNMLQPVDCAGRQKKRSCNRRPSNMRQLIVAWITAGLILGFYAGGLSASLKSSQYSLGPLSFLYRLILQAEGIEDRHLCPATSDTRLGLITIGNQEKPNVALMFNLDWGQDLVPEMLDILDRHNVKSTFFVTGTFARKNTELVRRISQMGHEIATHGEEHKDPTSLDPESLKELIVRGAKTIEEVTGTKPPPLFSPPSGDWNDSVVKSAQSLGFATVLWTVNTADWQLPPPDVITKRALESSKNGALILLHPTKPTIQALPSIIAGLRSKGFTLTTVATTISG
jgi:peptidoglycan/xylan/chitin deacetylase (PgdA/CDA1 family)